MKMSSLIPLEHLQNLRCALCNHYLSVPPIITISRDALKHKCGRCEHVQTEIAIRNMLYEKLAEISTFHCTYPNCEEDLKWGEVEAHEKVCVHKTINCPVSWSCHESISIMDLSQHCSEFHRKNVTTDEVMCSVEETLEKNKITVMLLIKNEIPFLVFRVVTNENIWIKVFSLLPMDDCKFELAICNDSGGCCLYYKYPVELFIENKHCKQCTMNSCDNKLHKKYKKKMDEAVADNRFHKITKEMVTELKMKHIKCKILLNDTDIHGNE